MYLLFFIYVNPASSVAKEKYFGMTVLRRVREFLEETQQEFINSEDFNFAESVLVFGNESTGKTENKIII